MTNQPQLPQDTLDRLSAADVSQEEIEAALYRILINHIPQDMIDDIWQEIKQAGIFVAVATSDGAEGARKHRFIDDCHETAEWLRQTATPKPDGATS